MAPSVTSDKAHSQPYRSSHASVNKPAKATLPRQFLTTACVACCLSFRKAG